MEDNQSQNPEVSIIMPSYNRAHLIMRAINSVLAQTFKNWELIIIDDGSKDNTVEVVKSLTQDPRVIYTKLDKNVGLCNARNQGLKKARAKLIAFLDSDDEWLPNKLMMQVAVFHANPKVGLVYTGANFVNVATGESRVRSAKVRGNVFDTVLATNPIGGPSRVMVLKECFDRVGYFDPDFVALEDWDMWTRISKIYSLDVVPEPLINYYEGYEDSVSINTGKLVSGYQSFWRKNNITEKDKNILVIHYAKIGHRLCYYNDLRHGREYLMKAFLLNWWNPEHVILLLASYLGNGFYRRFTFFMLKITQ